MGTECHLVHATGGAQAPDQPAAGRVPQPHGPGPGDAVIPGSGQQSAMGTERHLAYATGGAQDADQPAAGRVPQPYGPAPGDAGHQSAIGAEGHAVGNASDVQDAYWPADAIPQAYGAVPVGAGQQPAVGAERHAGNSAVEGGGAGVPDADQ